jgi:hypothetical protein
MSQSRKDQLAETAIKTAILKLFGAEIIDEIEVNPGEDHSGEQTLFTTVFLKAAQKRMTGSQLLDAIAAASAALRELEDYRFPYVTFLAPEEERESAEDTRPAA